MKLVVASNNKHKIKEISAVLDGKFELISLEDAGIYDDLFEDSDTLKGNAFLKADFIYKKLMTDCFADDTGLEVLSLNREPGVKSARYAGEERNNERNIELLLRNLKSKEDTTARFVTIICLILQGETYYFKGELYGKIIDEGIGNGGFGYDPIFLPDGFNKTLAEMSLAEKNAISHRALAIKEMALFLKNRFKI